MNATIPALQPPPGIQSNFKTPENQAYLTIIPCAAIVGVMIIFVFIRMYTKVYTLKSVGWDDCTLRSPWLACRAIILQLTTHNRHMCFCGGEISFAPHA